MKMIYHKRLEHGPIEYYWNIHVQSVGHVAFTRFTNHPRLMC